jgi:hypothetical protein
MGLASSELNEEKSFKKHPSDLGLSADEYVQCAGNIATGETLMIIKKVNFKP